MALLCGIGNERKAGPELAITCPKCKGHDLLAQSYELVETMNLFWVLPILRHRNTIIVCPNCQSKLFCKMGLHQLKYATPDELDRSLTADAGGLVIILFLLSLVFLMCPLVNLIPALFIPIVNRHSSRANRIAGYVPIALAIAYNTWFIWSFIKAGSDNSP